MSKESIQFDELKNGIHFRFLNDENLKMALDIYKCGKRGYVFLEAMNKGRVFYIDVKTPVVPEEGTS